MASSGYVSVHTYAQVPLQNMSATRYMHTAVSPVYVCMYTGHKQSTGTMHIRTCEEAALSLTYLQYGLEALWTGRVGCPV